MNWEIGGRRIPRQPGQVRKEAALTSSVRVACPVSHLVPTRTCPDEQQIQRAPIRAFSDFMTQDENQPPENEPSDSAPVIDADAPGFDMLAEADAENNVQSGADYKVLARKYRPRNFDDLIGQESMVRTLTNAFETGRIAHAFMLTGVRGVGKTTTARILARALNYTGAGPMRRA